MFTLCFKGQFTVMPRTDFDKNYSCTCTALEMYSINVICFERVTSNVCYAYWLVSLFPCRACSQLLRFAAVVDRCSLIYHTVVVLMMAIDLVFFCCEKVCMSERKTRLGMQIFTYSRFFCDRLTSL